MRKIILSLGLLTCLLICFSACSSSYKEDSPIEIGGTYQTKHTTWQLEYYTQDSAAFVKREVREIITVEKRGDGIYIPQLDEYFIVEPFQGTPLIPEDAYRFIPEDQTGATINKINATFYEFGDSLILIKFYDYTPYPLDQRFVWEGRKL